MKKFIGLIFGISVVLGLGYYDPAHAQVINPAGVRTCTNEGAGSGVCDTTNSSKTNLAFKSIAGTSNQVNISAAGTTVTLSTPQNIDSNATPTFGGLNLTGNEVLNNATYLGGKNASNTTGRFVGINTSNQIYLGDIDNIGTGTLYFGVGGVTATTLTSSLLTTPAINFGQTTLSRYQEGTFTPGIAFGGASVGITYSVQNGYYTVIGNRVFANLELALTSKGTSTGAAFITGLPFTSNSASNNYSAASLVMGGGAATINIPQAHVVSNSSQISLFNFTNGSLTTLSNADFTNTTSFTVSVQYQK